jgi:hypothetical protein
MAISLFLPDQRNTNSARSPLDQLVLQLVYEFATPNNKLQRTRGGSFGEQ